MQEVEPLVRQDAATDAAATTEEYDEFTDVLLILEHSDVRTGCASCSKDSCWRYCGRTVRARMLFGVVLAHAAWLAVYGGLQLADATRPGQCEPAPVPAPPPPCASFVETYATHRASYARAGICMVAPPLHGNLGTCANGTIITTSSGRFVTLGVGRSCRVGCDVGRMWELVEPQHALVRCLSGAVLSPPFCGPVEPVCKDTTCKRQKKQLFYGAVVILLAVYLLVLAVDWLAYENEYASFAFLFVGRYQLVQCTSGRFVSS
jgi:hypothetical protein